MQPVPLTAPYGGVNELLPVIALQSPQCENLFNFNVTETGVIVRHGDSIQRTIDIPASLIIGYRLLNYNGLVPRVLLQDSTAGQLRVINGSTGVVEHSVAEIIAFTPIYTLYFNRHFFVFVPGGTSTPGFVYNTNTSTYGAIGYTAAPTFLPRGGNTFNNRAYIILDNASYGYSGVDAISGALTVVDLSSLTAESVSLCSIASFTLSDQVAAVAVQCFIFFNGEILFYSGDYPNAPNWTLLQRTKVGRPLGENNWVQLQGDTLILVDTGLVSLRETFLKGSAAATNLTVNARVQSTWKSLCQGLANGFGGLLNPFGANSKARAVYDTKNNRVIISFPGYIDSTGTVREGSFYFIFDTLRESWYYHRSYGLATGDVVVDMVAPGGDNVYFLVQTDSDLVATIYIKEGATGFTDRNALNTDENGFVYDVTSAPVSIDNAYVQMVNGMDVIWKTDLDQQTNFTFIKDLGVAETTDQKIPPYGTSGTLQKPYVNAGIDGSYIQYQMSGTTTIEKTVGLELYGTTMWIQKGEGQTR